MLALNWTVLAPVVDNSNQSHMSLSETDRIRTSYEIARSVEKHCAEMSEAIQAARVLPTDPNKARELVDRARSFNNTKQVIYNAIALIKSHKLPLIEAESKDINTLNNLQKLVALDMPKLEEVIEKLGNVMEKSWWLLELKTPESMSSSTLVALQARPSSPSASTAYTEIEEVRCSQEAADAVRAAAEARRLAEQQRAVPPAVDDLIPPILVEQQRLVREANAKAEGQRRLAVAATDALEAAKLAEKQRSAEHLEEIRRVPAGQELPSGYAKPYLARSKASKTEQKVLESAIAKAEEAAAKAERAAAEQQKTLLNVEDQIQLSSMTEVQKSNYKMFHETYQLAKQAQNNLEADIKYLINNCNRFRDRLPAAGIEFMAAIRKARNEFRGSSKDAQKQIDRHIEELNGLQIGLHATTTWIQGLTEKRTELQDKINSFLDHYKDLR